MSINLSGLRENVFATLKDILSVAHGETPVYLNLEAPAKALVQKTRVQMVVGENFYVSPSEKLIQDIGDLLGEERLKLHLTL